LIHFTGSDPTVLGTSLRTLIEKENALSMQNNSKNGLEIQHQ